MSFVLAFGFCMTYGVLMLRLIFRDRGRVDKEMALKVAMDFGQYDASPVFYVGPETYEAMKRDLPRREPPKPWESGPLAVEGVSVFVSQRLAAKTGW